MRGIILLFFFSGSLTGRATFQLPDVLITGNDTMPLWCNPLESNPEFEAIRLQNGEVFCHTACWRGYYATWALVENELYLSSIRGCCDLGDSLVGKFIKLHPEINVAPGIKATWFDGELLASQGEMIRMFHYQGYHAVHESELFLGFTGGVLRQADTLNNSKSLVLVLSQNEVMLEEYVMSKINWGMASAETLKDGLELHFIFYWQRYGLQGIIANCDDPAIDKQLGLLFSQISMPIPPGEQIKNYVWQGYVKIEAKVIKARHG